MEGGVDLVRRALEVKNPAGPGVQSQRELPQYPALADPGLARQQHHLSVAAAGLAPAVAEQSVTWNL